MDYLAKSLSIMDKKKRSVLLILGLAIIAIVILMISLPGFHLVGGEPLPFDTAVIVPFMGSDVVLPGGNVLFWIIRGFMALMIVGLPIYIIYCLLTPQGRRRLLAEVIIVGVMIFLLDRIARNLQEQPKKEETAQSSEAPYQQSPSSGTGSSPSEQFEANTPEWLVWTVSIVAAVLMTGLVAFVVWFYYKRHYQRLTPVDRLAREAVRAADALKGGEDFKNTIIRCYYQMSQIIYAERGIRRDIAMTPSEFELALVEKGIPKEPIQFLTRIFEDVRYGKKQPAKGEEEKAIWFLTVIAEASKNSSSV